MVISRRRFAENEKEMYTHTHTHTRKRKKKKHVKGVQSFCFGSLNMQHLWRCRCRRVVDLDIPTSEFKPTSTAARTSSQNITSRF